MTSLVSKSIDSSLIPSRNLSVSDFSIFGILLTFSSIYFYNPDIFWADNLIEPHSQKNDESHLRDVAVCSVRLYLVFTDYLIILYRKLLSNYFLLFPASLKAIAKA